MKPNGKRRADWYKEGYDQGKEYAVMRLRNLIISTRKQDVFKEILKLVKEMSE